MSTANSSSDGQSRLAEFAQYFDLTAAVTQEQRNMVYQIRYRVYCEEFGYESPEAFRDHLETDDFDDQSMHCLVTHKASGVPVGCVRVVMPQGNNLMPMEIHAGASIDQDFMRGFQSKRNTLCEISRLAVDGAFRRRRKEQENPIGNVDALGASEWERRTFPLIALALMVGAGALADALNRRHCLAIMEPFLPIMMRRAGIHFRRIGEDFEFRGTRAPYYANTAELFENAPEELRLYFNIIRKRFVAALESAGIQSSSGSSAPEMIKVAVNHQ